MMIPPVGQLWKRCINPWKEIDNSIKASSAYRYYSCAVKIRLFLVEKRAGTVLNHSVVANATSQLSYVLTHNSATNAGYVSPFLLRYSGRSTQSVLWSAGSHLAQAVLCASLTIPSPTSCRSCTNTGAH